MTRAILSALVLLVLPAAARADVFVPADPPVASAECIAGERDVLALGLEPGEVGVLPAARRSSSPGWTCAPWSPRRPTGRRRSPPAPWRARRR